eukprot:CAMPEP_0113899206 /NCGR_PEP_ID=MMETSP0780_2-20120614/19871_1 /TAXON_ID=652834 /ORGANISM="Palpitomonas bilix" /LENGTH=63 /DNA_ID=CAMNT_0000891285 /DNA_START=118 /DNA_END=309 /DNA_ORIENTATION=- /assembly_acc=CAM_ASM_000599
MKRLGNKLLKGRPKWIVRSERERKEEAKREHKVRELRRRGQAEAEVVSLLDANEHEEEREKDV